MAGEWAELRYYGGTVSKTATEAEREKASEWSLRVKLGCSMPNKRRARDRRPVAIPAKPEKSRLGGGPRRRALGADQEDATGNNGKGAKSK